VREVDLRFSASMCGSERLTNGERLAAARIDREGAHTAEAVGTIACEDCHNVEPDFCRDSPHKPAFFRDGINAGCESCHGAGSVHSE